MVPITDLDRRQAERRAQAKAASEPVADVRKPTAASKAQQPTARKSDRWATHNAFVDVIAPRLTLAERAVWHVMFRHARDGKCETTARLLASAANISPTTAQAALSRLQSAGLVWPIWKSKDKAQASKYGINSRPAECLARLTK